MAKAVEEVFALRPFGRTGLMVPPISVGCAPLGNMVDTFAYGVSEEDAVATILAALDSPINYIDTAAWYGDGESERRVGLAIRELGGLPEGATLQTKEGRDPRNDDYSGETVKRRFERSLELLGVDRVPIVYLHDAEWTTYENAFSTGGPIEVLQGYREQGAIGFLGVASGPIDLEVRYREWRLRRGDHPQPLHAAQYGGQPAARRRIAARDGGAQRGAVRERDAGEGAGRVSTIRLSDGIGGDDRSCPGDSGDLRAVRGATCRGRVAVLAEGPEDHEHDSRHVQSKPHPEHD
jgi:hypothetical protein